MAVTRDAVTHPADVTATSQTFAHTCTGSNRALAVFVSMSDVAAISSVTYGGNAMTVVQNITLGTGERIAFFVLNAPAAGTANVVITVASSCNIIGAAYSVNGADQVDCVSVHATTQGSSNSPLLGIDSTSTQELVVAGLVTDGNVAMSPGAGGETEEWDITGASTVRHGGYSLPANGGTTNINPSLASSITWGMVGLAFKAAAGGGGGGTTAQMRRRRERIYGTGPY